MRGGEGEENGDGGSPEIHHIVHTEDRPVAVKGLEVLTDRERQVVACLAMGRSTKEVAFALGIADATVRVLLARAAGKLGVHTRGELLLHPAVQPLRLRPPPET